MQGAIQEIIEDEKRNRMFATRSKYSKHLIRGIDYKDNGPDYDREAALERYRNTLSK